MPEFNDVAIRVDADAHEELVEFLKADGGSYLVVKELEGSNPHYHVVLHSTRKLPAIRTALKRAMPGLRGNGSYSVTAVRDLGKYQRYMMKGESAQVMPHVVAAYGLAYGDDSWQEEQHDAYWAEAEDLQRKRKKAPIMNSIYEQCTADGIEWHQRDKIARVYIKELVSRDKPINIFSLRSQINLIQVKLCPDDTAIDNLVSSV